MSVVVVGSVVGSPGATRLAVGLAAAWRGGGRRVLLEADADGGRLGAELGVGVEPGLMALALAARSDGLTAGAIVERVAAPVGHWHVVPAPPSSEQAASALAHAAATLATTLAADASETVWIVDAGRVSTRSPAFPFARAADHVVIVTAGTFPELQLVPHRVDALRAAGCRVMVAVVEPTAWSAHEVADFVGADVGAVLPRVRGRGDGLAAVSGQSWRRWWQRVEELSAVLAGEGSDGATAGAEAVAR